MRVLALIALLLSMSIIGCGKKDDSAPATAGSSSSGGSSAVAKESKYDKGPRAAEEEIDEALAKVGEGLFSTKGCTACHAFGQKMSGPDMAGVSRRRTSEWMKQQILHPDLMVKEDPIARQLFATHALQMPNQGLTEEEAKSVIEYLKARDHEAGEGH